MVTKPHGLRVPALLLSGATLLLLLAMHASPAITNSPLRVVYCVLSSRLFDRPCEQAPKPPVNRPVVARSATEENTKNRPSPEVQGVSVDQTANALSDQEDTHQIAITVVSKPEPAPLLVSQADRFDTATPERQSVSLELFTKQVDKIYDRLGERIRDKFDDLENAFETASLTITGRLYDSTESAGSSGYLLQSTGSGVAWVATSSLGISGGGFSTTAIDTSSELMTIVSDETGSGRLVFSASPAFSGTATFSALTATSTLTLSGTAANIALGSNWLSGDGDDEGVYVYPNGDVYFGLGYLGATASGTLYTASLGNTNAFYAGVDAGSGATAADNANLFGFSAGINAVNASESNFLGNYAGGDATNASRSNFFGTSAGDGATGANNANFFGYTAGYQATDANNSNFFGQNAGYQATNALHSNFFGNEAGSDATNAFLSNFAGYRAGFGATNAQNSNFFGENAGYQATDASYSNFLGYYAGRGATNALRSNFIGLSAGYNAIDASYSNFLGHNAGLGAASSSNAIFIGTYAGYNDTVNNTSNGGSSIAIGRYAGTGGFSNSIALGRGVINSAATQLNIGNLLYATGIYNSDTQSAAAVVGGKVGIGTDVPQAALEVVGDIVSKGTSWATSSAAGDNDDWTSVTYGNGLFVAVGTAGLGGTYVMTSPDGITWTARSAAGNNDAWRAVTYGNGLFVAVGYASGDRVMTSPDGITWTARSAAGDDDNWYAVTYGNGIFVAVGDSTGSGESVMTSPDGITWTARSAAGDNDPWKSVTYGNGIFVAVGDSTGTGNSVMTSSDGITWTSHSVLSDNDHWRSVTYGNGIFVAVGFSGDTVMTSSDGTTWTGRTAAGNNDVWTSVTYGNGLFVAVGSGGSGFDHAITSPDGINWTVRSVVGNNDGWQSVTYNNGRFVAVGDTGGSDKVMYSGKPETSAFAHNNIYQGGMNIFGNVGIGTTTPSEKLTVYGTGLFTDILTAPIFNASGASTTILTLDGTALMRASSTRASIGVGGYMNVLGGDANSAFGYYALNVNTSGDFNTAIGQCAMCSNTTGYENTALGNDAMFENTTGYNNVALGAGALYYNTTGNSNIGIGYRSAESITGNYNIGIGELTYWSASDPSMERNIAIGYQAASSLQDGSDNLFLGYNAGDGIMSGSNNIYIGHNIGGPSTVNSALNIGNLLFGTNVDGTGTTLSSGNIGIGTSTPATKLQINDNQTNTTVGAIGVLLRNDTSRDYLNFWNHSADVFAIESADESTYRTLALQPHGGYVSIGTTTIGGVLDVVNNGVLGLRVQGTNPNAMFRVANTSTGGDFLDIEPSTTGVEFEINDANVMTLSDSGNVSIPSGQLTVNGAGSVGSLLVHITHGGVADIALFYETDTYAPNGAAAAMKIGSISSTGRSINAGGTINASGADFAEYFYQENPGSLENGELTCLSESGKAIECLGSMTPIGVVSTKPGFVGNDLYDDEHPEKTALVGLTGQVPTKVNLEGGPITAGDRLAPSSVAGYAKKATETGYTVGIALEDFNGSDSDPIVVFIEPELTFVFDDLAALGLAPTSEEETETSWLLRMKELAMHFIDGVLTIAGINAEEGSFSEKICIGETCVTEDELKALLQEADIESESVSEPVPELPSMEEEEEGVGTSTPSGEEEALSIEEPLEEEPPAVIPAEEEPVIEGDEIDETNETANMEEQSQEETESGPDADSTVSEPAG